MLRFMVCLCWYFVDLVAVGFVWCLAAPGGLFVLDYVPVGFRFWLCIVRFGDFACILAGVVVLIYGVSCAFAGLIIGVRL